jgi:hypothetical protein
MLLTFRQTWNRGAKLTFSAKNRDLSGKAQVYQSNWHTKVIQGIENTEDVKTVLNSLLREVINGIITGYDCQLKDG